MERKMRGRQLIRLSLLQDKLHSANLEEMDWVTFGIIIKKKTPQSSSNGKTFSIWHLNDLRDFSRSVSLFLFGDVHKEHWKTDKGMAVCLSVDHPQKILILGEAMDLGTCKAKKKNGEPCTQIVNQSECEYCQYHIQTEYRKLSSKRADLQAAAAVPRKKIQTTLTNLVVKGVDAILQETQGKLEEFKELLAMPSSGARNLSKHFDRGGALGFTGKPTSAVHSISASALLKQQKRQMLEARKRRSNEIQRRFLQDSAPKRTPASPSSVGQAVVQSPTPGAEFPKAGQLSSPQTPRLGSGFSEGDDVLFFDDCPPPALKLNRLAEAKKIAAIRKLRAKGQILSKEDPNSVKRKRSDLDVPGISERVQKNITSSEGFEAEMQERYFEPLVKKEQMEEKMRNIREVKCRVATCKTEKKGPKIGAETLLPRGEEHAQFLNSMK
ncbi:hypothetical protein Chor_010382 [Crotalus horridus]